MSNKKNKPLPVFQALEGRTHKQNTPLKVCSLVQLHGQHFVCSDKITTKNEVFHFFGRKEKNMNLPSKYIAGFFSLCLLALFSVDFSHGQSTSVEAKISPLIYSKMKKLISEANAGTPMQVLTNRYTTRKSACSRATARSALHWHFRQMARSSRAT